MSTTSIRKLAQDGRWIPGIYNYCDSWCERCRLSSRCLAFARRKLEEETHPSESFAQQIQRHFEEAMSLLHEKADELGIDLPDKPDPAYTAEVNATRDLVYRHPLVEAAHRYASMARRWLEANVPRGSITAVESHAPQPARQKQVPEADLTREQAVEVIERYTFFIAAKLTRALWSFDDEREEKAKYGEHEFPRDGDGSAKVALGAIETSLDAWFELMFYENDRAPIMTALLALTSLREAVQQAFPNAQAFVRPGFDTGDTAWPEEFAPPVVGSPS